MKLRFPLDKMASVASIVGTVIALAACVGGWAQQMVRVKKPEATKPEAARNYEPRSWAEIQRDSKPPQYAPPVDEPLPPGELEPRPLPSDRKEAERVGNWQGRFDAGWAWAEQKHIKKHSLCGDDGGAFAQGCRAFVDVSLRS